MLRCALLSARTAVQISTRRSLGLSAPVCNAQLDPIQQLFVDKIREYRKLSSDGKAVGMTPELEKSLQDRFENLARTYNLHGQDPTKFPTFSFQEPKLDAVGVEVAVKAVEEDTASQEKEQTDELYYFNPPNPNKETPKN